MTDHQAIRSLFEDIYDMDEAAFDAAESAALAWLENNRDETCGPLENGAATLNAAADFSYDLPAARMKDALSVDPDIYSLLR